MTDDKNALVARVELVAMVLTLPDIEVDTAIASDDGLIAFARRHHQSLDWLCYGDVRGMIARRAVL